MYNVRGTGKTLLSGSFLLKAVLVSLLCMHTVSFVHGQNSGPDTEYGAVSRQILEQKLESSRKSGKVPLLAHLARLNWLVLPQKSLEYSKEALTLAEERGNEQERITALSVLAGSYYFLGDNNLAYYYVIKALDSPEIRKDSETLALAYEILGLIHWQVGKFPDAEDFFLKAKKIYETLDIPQYIYLVDNSLASVYLSQLRYAEGLEILNEALAFRERRRVEGASSLVYFKLGTHYYQTGDTEEALDYFARALEISVEEDEAFIESLTLLALGRAYFERGDTEQAVIYGRESLEIAAELGAMEIIQYTTLFLSYVYERRGQYNLALSMHRQYAYNRDVINNTQLYQSLQDVSFQLQLEEKDNTILELYEESFAQHFIRNILIIISLFIVGVAIVTFFMYRAKRRTADLLIEKNRELMRSERELKNSNETKDKLFSIIAHDLRNPIGVMLNGITILQNNEFDDPGKREKMIGDLKNTAARIYSLLENLIYWVKNQKDEICTEPELIVLHEAVDEDINLVLLQAQQKGITIVKDIRPDTVISADKMMVHTIIRNFLNNAIKFTRKGGTVTISTGIVDGMTALQVTDTGVGMENHVISRLLKDSEYISTRGTSLEKGTGLGLMLCRELLERNGGYLLVESVPGKGSVVSALFPPVAAAGIEQTGEEH